VRLFEIKPLHEAEAFTQDFAANAGKRLQDAHFELAYNAVKNETLTIWDIKKLAKSMPENQEFDRTVGSAEFILIRMHILVQGAVPHGITEKNAEQFFDPSGPMYKFVATKEINGDENMQSAKVDVKKRSVRTRMKEPEARVEFSNYYYANKETLSRPTEDQKEEIIKLLRTGRSSEEAFAAFKL